MAGERLRASRRNRTGLAYCVPSGAKERPGRHAGWTSPMETRELCSLQHYVRWSAITHTPINTSLYNRIGGEVVQHYDRREKTIDVAQRMWRARPRRAVSRDRLDRRAVTDVGIRKVLCYDALRLRHLKQSTLGFQGLETESGSSESLPVRALHSSCSSLGRKYRCLGGNGASWQALGYRVCWFYQRKGSRRGQYTLLDRRASVRCNHPSLWGEMELQLTATPVATGYKWP